MKHIFDRTIFVFPGKIFDECDKKLLIGLVRDKSFQFVIWLSQKMLCEQCCGYWTKVFLFCFHRDDGKFHKLRSKKTTVLNVNRRHGVNRTTQAFFHILLLNVINEMRLPVLTCRFAGNRWSCRISSGAWTSRHQIFYKKLKNEKEKIEIPLVQLNSNSLSVDGLAPINSISIIAIHVRAMKQNVNIINGLFLLLSFAPRSYRSAQRRRRA